jgi:hypothetical protein
MTAPTVVQQTPVQKNAAALGQLNADLLRAHRTPVLDTAAEPWIGVSYLGGEYREVSLRTALQDSHLIVDIAETHQLARAAMRRFLGACAVHVVRVSGLTNDRWRDLFRDNTGFPADDIESFLAAQAGSLWLYHPVKPFLQDLRLARFGKTVEPKPIAEIVPGLAGGGSATWFVKPTERPMVDPLTPAATARWLVASWFYSLNGNGSLFAVPGATKKTPHAGSVYSECQATITNTWRVGTTLFRTLLRNIADELVRDQQAAGYACAWQDPGQPAVSSDPLYRSTITASALLLLAPVDGMVAQVVRGPIIDNQEHVKSLRDAARDADPHRPKITETTRAGKTTFKALRLEPTNQMTALLRGCYTGPFAGADLRGVVDTSSLWLKGLAAKVAEREAVEILMASKNGAGTGPVWGCAVTTVLPARYLDPSGLHIGRVRAVAAAAFDPKTGLLKQLHRAVLTLLAPERYDSDLVKGAVANVQQEWMVRAETTLRQAFDDTGNSSVYLTALHRDAREAFVSVFYRYSNSTRFISAYEQALQELSKGTIQ